MLALVQITRSYVSQAQARTSCLPTAGRACIACAAIVGMQCMLMDPRALPMCMPTAGQLACSVSSPCQGNAVVPSATCAAACTGPSRPCLPGWCFLFATGSCWMADSPYLANIKSLPFLVPVQLYEFI